MLLLQAPETIIPDGPGLEYDETNDSPSEDSPKQEDAYPTHPLDFTTALRLFVPKNVTLGTDFVVEASPKVPMLLGVRKPDGQKYALRLSTSRRLTADVPGRWNLTAYCEGYESFHTHIIVSEPSAKQESKKILPDFLFKLLILLLLGCLVFLLGTALIRTSKYNPVYIISPKAAKKGVPKLKHKELYSPRPVPGIRTEILTKKSLAYSKHLKDKYRLSKDNSETIALARQMEGIVLTANKKLEKICRKEKIKSQTP